MSWYMGVHSCGHEGSIELVGTKSYKERRAKQYFSDLCPDCLKKKHEERAKRIEQEYDMPKLISGTEKQIDWANTIRADFFDFCEENDLIADYIINTKMEAKFWIDNRDELFVDKSVWKWNAKIKRELEGKAVLNEDTIRSYRGKYEENVVEIIDILVKDTNEYCVGLKYKRNEAFIEFVKNENYHWAGAESVWYKEIKNEEEWKAEAERMGIVLLRAGYSICIHDEDILTKLKAKVW